jgi:hypothetical protein
MLEDPLADDDVGANRTRDKISSVVGDQSSIFFLHGTTPGLLGTELSLSSRGRMTLGVGAIFWFISHTLPQCHALQGVGYTYL